MGSYYYTENPKHLYDRLKSNRDLFLFNSNATHFQPTNTAHISVEVLDDYVCESLGDSERSPLPLQ